MRLAGGREAAPGVARAASPQIGVGGAVRILGGLPARAGAAPISAGLVGLRRLARQPQGGEEVGRGGRLAGAQVDLGRQPAVDAGLAAQQAQRLVELPRGQVRVDRLLVLAGLLEQPAGLRGRRRLAQQRGALGALAEAAQQLGATEVDPLQRLVCMAGLGLPAAAAAAVAQAVGLELQHAQLVLGQPGAGVVERRVAEQAAALVEAGGARRLLQLERRLRGLAPSAGQLEQLDRLAVVALDRQQLGGLLGAGRGVAVGHVAEGGAQGRLDRQALVADLRRQPRRALEVAGPHVELRRLVLAARGHLLLGERAVVAGEQRQELRLRHVGHSHRRDVDFDNSIALLLGGSRA